jgi:hypothetical protein
MASRHCELFWKPVSARRQNQRARRARYPAANSARLKQMTLFAHSIRFGEPRGDFIIDFVDVLETKRVKVISRRESFDPAKAWALETTREDDMTVDPVSANDERGETHADVKRDPGFLRQNGDRSVFLRDGQQLVEDRADGFRLTGEMRGEGVSPAGVRLIAIRERAPATRTAPERRFGTTSSDRNSDNGRGRCGNSRKWPARGAENFAGTCRTSGRRRPGNRCR